MPASAGSMLPPTSVAELRALLDVAAVRIHCALDELANGRYPEPRAALDALLDAIEAVEAARAQRFDISAAQQNDLRALAKEIQRDLGVLLLADGIGRSRPSSSRVFEA